MLVSVVFCVVFISPGTAEIWRLKQHISEWTIQTVRKHVDMLNVLDSVKTMSLTGCVNFCSGFDEIIVPSLYFKLETGQCTCNSAKDETNEDESESEIVYGIRTCLTKVELADSFSRTTVWPLKQDCSDLLEDLHTKDGVYVIHPPGGQLTDAWCDMTNGGWTVLQRRMDGSEDFYRGWNDYVNGFGNKNGEYWLGLENMHHLTKNGSELFVHMKTFPGVKPSSMTARYSNFKIGNIDSKYTLYISGFNGNCGDSFSSEKRHPFSTFDNDNDKELFNNCAESYQAGWWYNACHESHLNGLYYQEREYKHTNKNIFATGIHWYSCWGRTHSLKYSVMRIKRRTYNA